LGCYQSPSCYTKVSLLHTYQGFTVFIHPIYPWLAGSSVAAVQKRDTDVPKHLAEELNLTYTAFGSAISTQYGPSAGTLKLSEAWGTELEPAPVTPSDEDSAPWRLFSGTIKATFNAHRGLDGPNNIFVSPGIMSGNTGECTRPVCVQLKLDNVWATGVVHRYEVLLEPHAPHCPVQPPRRRERSLTAKQYTYRQRAYVWIPLQSLDGRC
jgi:hypothetical protein